MILRFSHFGHAVKSIDEVLPVYKKLWGLKPSTRTEFPEDWAINALLPVGQNYIELLQPTSQQSSLAKFINQRGEGMYHLSWVVDDVDKEIKSLRSKGAQVAETPPQTNLITKRGWIHPRSTMGLLIELVDEKLLSHLGHLPKKEPQPGSQVVAWTHVHHVVKNIDQALAMYDRLWGLKAIKRATTPLQGVKNAIVRIGKMNYIELLEPTDPKGLIAKFIEKRGEGLRSFCFTVDNFKSAITSLKKKGVELYEASDAPGDFQIKSAWISPKYTRGLLVEICEHRELLAWQDPELKL
ncbi:MAG: glyoxalase family protein [Dehalococcoidia bacterium]|nr:glyoxalase family protein [Dehalococcoidia bacterium]